VTYVTVSYPDEVGTYEYVTDPPFEVLYELEAGTAVDETDDDGTVVYETLCPFEVPVTAV
jgi:hypothetical protein